MTSEHSTASMTDLLEQMLAYKEAFEFFEAEAKEQKVRADSAEKRIKRVLERIHEDTQYGTDYLDERERGEYSGLKNVEWLLTKED